MTKFKRRFFLYNGAFAAALLASVMGWKTASFETANALEKSAVERTDEEIIGGERMVLRSPANSSTNAQARKRYPGGMDEDDLQVQSTLPIPSRSLDAVNSAAAETAND